MSYQPRQNRVRKLTLQDREAIRILRGNGISGKEVAQMFNVSQARVSQIVTDYYRENPEFPME